MTNPIIAFFKSLRAFNSMAKNVTRDTERLQMMQLNNKELNLNNKELSSAVLRIQSNNKELSSAVSRMQSRLKPRKAMPNPNRYFNVRMSPELAQQFNEIAEENNMNRAEVFRRAIGLYMLAKTADTNNEKIIIRSDTTERHITNI